MMRSGRTFLASKNADNLSAQPVQYDVSIYGVMAVDMTLVILTAGIDLSVGAILAFAAMSAAAILKGTGESRAIPEDPLAFGGFAWAERIGEAK
jgi:inositol transport system permease protein